MKRNYIRFITVIIASVICCNPLDAFCDEYRGEKSVGLRGGFTTVNTTATAGLYFSYRFSKYLRFSPKMEYAFRHNSSDAFSFNFDCEMPLSISSTQRVNVYPIVGLNYTTISTKYHYMIDENRSDDSSDRSNNFGLNVGGGIEFFATPTLRLAFESKCLVIKKNTGGWFSVSVGYRF